MSKQKPSIEQTTGPVASTRMRHPAFGEIRVSRSQCSESVNLFGSALSHRHMVSVEISTAHVDRHLNRDWIHGDSKVLEFSMSESQWASFVSSSGGGGTPITFKLRPQEDASFMMCPQIDRHESARETHSREIAEKCREYLALAEELSTALSGAVGDGKAGKGRLVELREMAERLSQGLPSTMSHIQTMSEVAMEKTIAAGKTEIEAHLNSVASRIGMESLREQSARLISSEDI